MTWLVVILVYTAHIGSVWCSMDEVKSGEKLMTSLQRVQQKLHAIRSIITKYSDHSCSTSLNKTDVGLADLQSCANNQIYVKDEWTRAMNPTLFELRHFRRTLLQVTGARKVLSPYFLAKISNFIQDEENIMIDAIRTAREICVTNQEKTPETQTIVQELKKYGNHEWSPATEEVDTTEESSTTSVNASTAGAPISASFRVEEWLLLPTTNVTTPEIVPGPNDTETTAEANESAPISGRCQHVGDNTCKSEYSVDEDRVIFSLGDEIPNRTTVSESSETVSPARSEVVRFKTEEEVTNRTEQHESQEMMTAHPTMAILGTHAVHFPLSENNIEDNRDRAGDIQTTSELSKNLTSNGETIERDWSKNWSASVKNWSDYNYGEDCGRDYAAIDCRISVIESHENDFNDSLQEFPNKPDGFSGDLSGDKNQTDCLNCSVASNISLKIEPTSGDGAISVVEALLDSNRTASTSDKSTVGRTMTNNYTSKPVGRESANCSNSETDDYDCIGLDDHSLPPLGTHG